MTNEQINYAIAKACGWTEIVNSGIWHNHKPWGYPPQPPGTGGNAYKYVPDYCSDLNAMHDAEKTLDEDQMWRMARNIELNEDRWYFHASARERAEAFLRTLGKWEEVQG